MSTYLCYKNGSILGEQMANPANPLRQYFRRPAIYITLPSKGKNYKQGSIDLPDNEELPVYPMTAIDEITAKTPDALFNGTAIAELIKSCVPAIKDPWSIPSTDLDTILVAIRAATNGNELDVESSCPSCTETNKYSINLTGLLTQITSVGYNDLFQLGELKLKFNPLTYKELNQFNIDQFNVQRQIAMLENIENQEERTKQSNGLLKKLTEMNVKLISATIESVITPSESVTNKDFIDEFLRGCDKNTFESIRSHVVKLREDSSIKPLKIKCPACSHDYEQPLALNATDFFE